MLRIPLENKIWQWIVLIFLSFIWGSSFILMKKGLVAYNNYQVAAFRVFFSFVLLLPVTLKNIRKISKYNLKSLLIAGYVGIAIPALLFTTAQSKIDSSLAGILNSMTPFFTLVVGMILYNSEVKFQSVVGIVLGFIGASGLIISDIHNIFSGVNWFATLVIIATLCYGINVNEIKVNLKGLTGVEITSLSMLFIGPVAGLYLLFSDFSAVAVNDNRWMSLFHIFLLAAFGSVLALIIFNTLIKYTTAIFAASVTYIIPVFAIVWGEFDGEKISAVQFLWTLLIILGVYLVNTKKADTKSKG